VAKELKEELHELAVWRLADTGWRTELASRLTALKEKRDRQLNTPKTQQIDDLFKQRLGSQTCRRAGAGSECPLGGLEGSLTSSSSYAARLHTGDMALQACSRVKSRSTTTM
jgi:hypothetical protein